MANNSETTSPAPKKRGWPLGKKRGPKRVAEARTDIRPNEAIRASPNYDYIDDDNNDRLRVPKELIPEGMDYQWVTAKIFGQEQPQRRARFEKRGWTPVPSERHDGLFMPKGYKGEIEVDGLVLYERPIELTMRARNRDRQKAREQVMIKEAQLMGGNIPISLDARHPTAVNTNKIAKSYERMEIPKE